MDMSNDFPGFDNEASLMNLSPTCFIAPKATGIVSLILQFALLIISVLVVLFFFYHVGGYEYMSWNENSTILEPIPHSKPLDSSATLAVELLQPKEVPNVSAEFTINTSTFLNIEQVPNTTVYLKFMDAILDMLELIRISTLVYVGICALWLMSIAFLLLSIKYEVLDMVSLNAVFLTVATMYAFAHALFIAVLLYYQRDLPWRTMAIVIGSAVILTFTAILGAVALALVIGWYRYIVYMNDSDKVG
uniref:MARVEL domain-containing protein n=1 Tax=Angiostrongylus cantonensis TaxID=6313 RepID=A0A0K0DNV0_ANGCA